MGAVGDNVGIMVGCVVGVVGMPVVGVPVGDADGAAEGAVGAAEVGASEVGESVGCSVVGARVRSAVGPFVAPPDFGVQRPHVTGQLFFTFLPISVGARQSALSAMHGALPMDLMPDASKQIISVGALVDGHVPHVTGQYARILAPITPGVVQNIFTDGHGDPLIPESARSEHDPM